MTAPSDAPSPSSTPARLQAVRWLDRVEQEGAYVGLLAEEEDVDLDAREQRQATDYVAGVTRWRRWLDFLLAQFYRGDFDEMDPPLRQVLRIGLYDLLFLQTPPHAAVHEAVELAKEHVHPRVAGLVNGILRSVQRRQERLPVPATGDDAEDLAIRHSHPTWMVRRWLERYGRAETEALLRWNNARPTFGLRVNTLVTSVADVQQLLDAEGAAWEASPYLDDFLRVPRLQPVFRAGLIADGRCAVQDESSGLVVRVLDPRPGETVVDTCAAPGGKAIYAAIRMRDEGRVLAFDVHEGRLRLVREAAATHGVHCIEAEVADLRELPEQVPDLQADRVLLDAPCSGTGVLAKRADLRWNRSEGDVDELAALQSTLLEAAGRLVRPGGCLVYSTCTIEPEENEQRVEAFLSEHPAFVADPADGPDALRTTEGTLKTLPHRHHVDGMFAARLRRTST